MKIFDYIDDKTILIVPSNIKKQILKGNNTLLNIKSYTKDELMKKIMFDYNEKTIHYMHKKYGYKIDICKMYLDNMYYVDNTLYESDKLNTLVEMKNDLLNNNLLIIDNLFLNSLSKKKVVVFGYYIDKFFKKMLDMVSVHTNVEIIENKDFKNTKLTAYEFNDIEAEINYVAYSICDLISKGININKIKLGNISDDYIIALRRIFNHYNIPINLNMGVPIYGKDMVLSFINLFTENKDLKGSLDALKEQYNLKESNNLLLYNKIVAICNNYLWTSDEDNILDMLIYDFKNTFIFDSKLDNAVEVINVKSSVIGDNYLFLMNFNQGSMPVIYQNVDYITDDLKSYVGLDTTYEKNMSELEICKDIILSIKNVIITYKLKSGNAEFYPSSLIDELDIDVIKNPSIDETLSYSNIIDELMLSKKLDKLIKYNEVDDEIGILYNNYKDVLYRVFDNKFDGIDNTVLLNYLNPKLKLSYSSIDDYFKCAFKYYVNHVMKLKSKEETFYLLIGKLFHYVLSESFTSDFDFDKTWDEYLKDTVLSPKESFFLSRLRKELIFIIDVINNQFKLSTFDKSLYEEAIYVNLNNKIPVLFSGVIDKIMYKDNTDTKVALVDYKTGRADINLYNVIHGLNMQLPVYLYLVKNSNKFNNPKFVGFYLQEILHNEIYNDFKTDYEKEKSDNLKLKGYTIDEEDLINEFDSSYADSRVIKSMRLTKNGFSAYSKILNNNQINNLIKLVSNKINEASTNILDGKFDINPKRIGGVNISCEYCTFHDMCYMREKDIVTLTEYKNLDFLGGENND
jgi:ATP-dependent helicase/nuclease subunit B